MAINERVQVGSICSCLWCVEFRAQDVRDEDARRSKERGEIERMLLAHRS